MELFSGQTIGGLEKSMSVTKTIIAGFMEEINSTYYDKITISSICAAAGVSRKTFYLHFQDKQAVVEQIIEEEIIYPVADLVRLLSFGKIKSSAQLTCEMMYNNIFKNRVFYENLLKHGGTQVFIDSFIDKMTKLNLSTTSQLNMPATEREYMTYFYAAAQAMLVKKWITNKFNVAPDKLAKYCTAWAYKSMSELTSGPSPWDHK